MRRSIRRVFLLLASITLGLLTAAPSLATSTISSPIQSKPFLETWVVYSFPFVYIGPKESNPLAELVRTGHEQLAAEISHQTSMYKPPLSFRLSDIDGARIASLIEQIQSLDELPPEEQDRLANIRPKFVIIPKYWFYSGLANVQVIISPFPNGLMTSAAKEHFRPENRLSGLQKLARVIACKLYRSENITVRDLENNAYKVGFRTFFNRGNNPAYQKDLKTIPEMLHSYVCSTTPPAGLEIQPFSPLEADAARSSCEYATIYHLDYVVEGYIEELFGILYIGMYIVNRDGATLKSFPPVQIQPGQFDPSSLQKTGDEIMKFLQNHLETRMIAGSPDQ
jgi:hypothetical protein